jgi:Xaa-Pro aminopeptidase
VDHVARRARLIRRFDDLGVDAFVTSHLPNVRYLSGFTGSNGHVLVHRDGTTFLTDGRYTEQSRREVPDVERRTYARGPAAALATACVDAGVTRIGFEPDHLSYQAWADVATAGPGLALIPARGEVELLRTTKDAEEIALIEAAQEAADHAFETVIGKLSEAVTEREVAFELEAAMRRAGADGVAFDTIVAFGPNAAEPHHRPTDRPLGQGDLVKIDLGALVDGYHSDMTRTVALGDPGLRLREVHEVVHQAQRAGVWAVRAGVAAREVDGAARAVIRDAGLGDAFTHPVGHGVGLEIHEAPWVRPRSADPLPEDAVVTVEPGIYLSGVGGVRIEDMVHVTAHGGRVLARTPKELIVL